MDNVNVADPRIIFDDIMTDEKMAAAQAVVDAEVPKPLTVKTLMEALAGLPADMPVVVSHCEYGYDERVEGIDVSEADISVPGADESLRGKTVARIF